MAFSWKEQKKRSVKKFRDRIIIMKKLGQLKSADNSKRRMDRVVADG